ncbi:hypothetical protein DM02DRAFT_655335 [Periconia macrospinosa]|uniref:Rhodopsin domain-containing protein n=1 Tax=Periconia macrospinosa TaxID=97972 RepID=A0A2V1DRE6_9PLEO|nr:hypothetical protein DM02DRAFT_655335 [Periconia macrospinosa]
MNAIEDLDTKMVRALYALSVVFTVLPIIAVCLRIQSRHRTKPRLLWDDWTILFSLISCILTAILVVIGATVGQMGRYLLRNENGEPIHDRKYVIFQKVSSSWYCKCALDPNTETPWTMFAVDLSQLLTIGPTKLSVLFLYRRLFGIEGTKFKFIFASLIIAVIMWIVAFFLTNTLQYFPVHTQWAQNPADMRPSMELTKMFLSQSYADVALDVIIICLPIPFVRKLQTNIQKKLVVTFIFLLGALTTEASVARTAVQYGVTQEFDKHNRHVTYYLCPIVYWLLVETSPGIIYRMLTTASS